MIKNCSLSRWCKHLVLARRISNGENDKPLNPFRKVNSHQGIIVDDGQVANGENDKPLNPFRKVYRFQGLIVDDGQVANRICLSVTGNGAVGQPSTICMFTDRKCYMFNCGEGVGRVFREDDLKVYDVRHVFITHKDWKKMSGLPDLYLSVQSYNRKKLTVHGPPHVEDVFGVTVSYSKHTRISKKPFENETFEDGTVEVKYVPIFSHLSVSSQLRKETRFTSFKHRRTESAVPCVPDGSNVVVCYICKGLSNPRNLSLNKCVELGVPLGPLLLELKNGNDVTLPSGKTVLSEDVLDPAVPSPVFFVVDCPSEEFLDPFVKEEKFKPYQMPTSATTDVCAIIHFTPPHIFDSYKYKAWINRFPPSTIHLVLNSKNLIPNKVAVQQLQHMLHLLHPSVFKPLPIHGGEVESHMDHRNIIHAEGGLMLHLRPSMYFDHNNVVTVEPDLYIQRAKTVPGFCESLSSLHSLLRQQQEKNKNADKYPELIFLGTGSACGSAYRACSCILVNISNEQSVVFDCGDGTYQQFVQYYGCHEIKNALMKISCVFISHSHTDHYMGLFQLIEARKEAFYSCNKKYVPLAVTIPRSLHEVFDNFENLFGPLRSDISIFPNKALNVGNDGAANRLKKYLKDVELRTVPVIHSYNSHGVVLSSGSDWKIVFSGDCSPSRNLVDAGKDCTVLIHEATFEDEAENHALAQYHSTISQALDVAQQMNAQHTIVTHFSSRYVEVPLIKDRYKNHSVGIAFDNMRVSLSELSSLPLLIPTLRCLFSERLDLHQVGADGTAGFEAVALKALRS